jgi:hypothetical protein
MPTEHVLRPNRFSKNPAKKFWGKKFLKKPGRKNFGKKLKELDVRKQREVYVDIIEIIGYGEIIAEENLIASMNTFNVPMKTLSFLEENGIMKI